MHLALEVAEHQRAPEHERSAQSAVQQPLGSPGDVAAIALPGRDAVAGVGCVHALLVGRHTGGSADVLGPAQGAPLGVHAAHGHLEAPGTDRLADAHRRTDQVGQALDLVGAARRGHGRLPTQRATQRVEPGQARALPHHQGVFVRQQNARLQQGERIAGALLYPQLAAVEYVEGLHAAVHAKHEDALAGHQGRRHHARRQSLAPQRLAAVEHDQLVVVGHHTRVAPVAANTGAELGLGIATPKLAPAFGREGDDTAIGAGHHHRIGARGHAQRHGGRADAVAPELAPDQLLRKRLECRGFGFFRPARTGGANGQDRGQYSGLARAKANHLEAPSAAAEAAGPGSAGAAGAAPSEVSLASTRRR